MRGVRQCLDRANNEAESRASRIADRLAKANTIMAALDIVLEWNDDQPSLEQIRLALRNGRTEASLFFQGTDYKQYFDFAFLDSQDLDQYLSTDVEEGDASEAGKSDDTEQQSEQQDDEDAEKEEDELADDEA